MSSNPEITLRRLTEYKQELDQVLVGYSQLLLVDTKNDYNNYSHIALNSYLEILNRGGKRMRGALTMCAYKMLGGTDQSMILQAAKAIEMIQAYLLIIDDISDNSAIRRGGPAAHTLMENYHNQHQLFGDGKHFGRSIAMHAGIIGNHLAMNEICQLSVATDLKLAAIQNLNANLVVTVHGQFNDIINEALQDVPEARVIDMLTWKTAYYSFLSPLQFGAILAAAKQADLDFLQLYSRNIGLAFQITDDIMGTFGNQFASGKSAKDDLREGKITILVARALQNASVGQKKTFLKMLGKPDLTDKEHQLCQKIIQETGALNYAQTLAKKYAQKAVLALDSAPAHWCATDVDFLRGVTDYIITRKS